jgi:hypothetical protein
MLIDFINKNIDIISKLQSKFPNNMDFGRAIRKEFEKELFPFNIHNDQDLGRSVRKEIKNLLK